MIFARIRGAEEEVKRVALQFFFAHLKCCFGMCIFCWHLTNIVIWVLICKLQKLQLRNKKFFHEFCWKILLFQGCKKFSNNVTEILQHPIDMWLTQKKEMSRHLILSLVFQNNFPYCWHIKTYCNHFQQRIAIKEKYFILNFPSTDFFAGAWNYGLKKYYCSCFYWDLSNFNTKMKRFVKRIVVSWLSLSQSIPISDPRTR